MTNTNSATVTLPRRLLCGVDLEGRAAPAVLAALWLAERLDAEVELAHAFPPRPLLWGKEERMPEWMAGPEEAGRTLREELRVILAQAPAEFALRTRADELRFHVTAGQPAHVILERARLAHADWIVLGPHHKRGLLDLSNTARGVLAYASGGVWMQPRVPAIVRRVLVPLDLSAASLHALETARDLARRLSARVTAIQAFVAPEFGASSVPKDASGVNYVVEHLQVSERDAFEAAMRSFDWRGIDHDVRFERGEPAPLVLAHQDDHDLIVMGTHGRTGLAAALLGSVAHAVLREARIPVLALRHAHGTYLI